MPQILCVDRGRLPATIGKYRLAKEPPVVLRQFGTDANMDVALKLTFGAIKNGIEHNRPGQESHVAMLVQPMAIKPFEEICRFADWRAYRDILDFSPLMVFTPMVGAENTFAFALDRAEASRQEVRHLICSLPGEHRFSRPNLMFVNSAIITGDEEAVGLKVFLAVSPVNARSIALQCLRKERGFRLRRPG